MNHNLAPLLRPDLNPADLAGDNGKYNRLYDRLAPLYNLGEWLARLKYGGGIAKMRREMMRLLDWQDGASVLYVSVGTGTDFRYFPDTVNAGSLKIVGADLSLGMLRRAQKNWQRRLNLSLVHCAAEDLPFADNSFDIVFHVGGINFFSDKPRVSAIENALPANVAERQTHILWDGRFYALTFVKAG